MGDKYGSYHTPDERERDPSEVTSLLRQAGFTAVRIGYGYHFNTADVHSCEGGRVGPFMPTQSLTGFGAIYPLRAGRGFVAFARK